ncbi:hypothetical protein AB6A40_005541 [Gnathostoma spinigerum]|uniref:Exonuclease domain-containing protein n=1 Tax=Gnathostoma spinigerum TaxID=75299 RepID=A0ABD6EQJ6_9BILA
MEDPTATGEASDSDDPEDLQKFHEKIVKVTNSVARKLQLSSDGGGNMDETLFSQDHILPVVEYEPPPRKDNSRVIYVMQHMHSMTTAEMRKELQLAHIDSRGKRSQIYNRLRKYFRKEYAIMKMAQPQSSKTEKFYDYFIVMDFECTCEEDVTDYDHEIIEFPAVLIDIRRRAVIDTFRSFVRPHSNEVLSEFCSKLTGITQDMVNTAPPFKDVLDRFRAWMASHGLGREGGRYAFVTDGPWDIAKFFQMQCIKSNSGVIPHDFRFYINIRKAFINKYKGQRLQRINLNGMLKDLGMKFEGREHSGIDDAKNIARIVIKMLEDRSELRVNEKIVRNRKPDKGKCVQSDMPKEERERQAWRENLPYKVVAINRESFISGEYLDCDSCEDEGDRNEFVCVKPT